jgi:hypothetical protein
VALVGFARSSAFVGGRKRNTCRAKPLSKGRPQDASEAKLTRAFATARCLFSHFCTHDGPAQAKTTERRIVFRTACASMSETPLEIRVTGKFGGSTEPAPRDPARTVDWTRLRRPEQPEDAALSVDAVPWLRNIPVPVRPLLVSRRYPRIINQMARNWAQVERTRGQFASLLLDTRGRRAGFPKGIVEELVRLRAHYETLQPTATPVNATVWDDVRLF